MGAAVLGASVVLTTAALPALADPVKVVPIERSDADFAKYHEEGINVWLEGHDDPDDAAVDANLIALYVIENGAKNVVQTYCVELPTQLVNGTPLHEVPWDQHPNATTKFKDNAKYVNWILHHSYPSVDFAKVGDEAGKKVTKREVIAATQAAIWHYSDGANLSTKNPTADDDPTVDANVKAVYDYLTSAKNEGDEQQPKPTLEIKPESLHGKAGDKPIGPFTLTTSASQVLLKAALPDGVKFTDADGKDLGSPVTAKDVYLKVPAGAKAGKVEFTVEASAPVNQGRLFVSVDKNDKTQSLVVAKSGDVSVKAKATADWEEGVVETSPSSTVPSTWPTTTTAVPSESVEVPPTITTTDTPPAAGADTDDLAYTGASIFVPLLIGLGLLAAGVVALIVVRRRKSA
ncbi:thioester domain-containing protein [Actinosynnema sp. NPDC020468]|uniref:thioester domain-containing protein n=1 Tax=Actinosynnema sp. NPDC020468 TaxID=3154488 RepID=UPI0033C1DB62